MAQPWHIKLNKLFLERQGDFTTAAPYGVEVLGISGSQYQVIGVHLTPAQNRGMHNVFFDVLDEAGHRIRGARVGYRWEGMRPEETPRPVVCDKPDNEPAGNLNLEWGMHVTTWVMDGTSDQVTKLHTAHPDQGDGNTRGHHSFYVVFQRRDTDPLESPPPPVPNPPVGTPGDPLRQAVRTAIDDLKTTISKLENSL